MPERGEGKGADEARRRGAAVPRIAVLPFEDRSLDGSAAPLARGLAEDAARELGRFATLEVVHPRSSLAEHADDEDAFARRLDADAVLGGSVERAGGALRVRVRLVEVGSRRQLWAERYDVPAEDLFAIEDEIAARVAGALAIRIDDALLDRSRDRPLSSLEAYELWVRGLDHLRRGTIDDDDRARALFERALAIDGEFARAWAGISLSHFNEWSCQAWELWEAKERLALDAARKAAALDPRDALTQAILARIRLYRRDFDEAATCVAQALALNPNDADVLANASLCRTYLGEAESGLALAERAVALHPLHDDWLLDCAALALCALGRGEEALAHAARPVHGTVDFAAWVASAAARSGDLRRARACLATFETDFVEKITFGRPPEPGEALRWLRHVNPFRRPADLEAFEEGLRLAGLEADPDERRVAVAEPLVEEMAELRKDGDTWRVAYADLSVRLSEVKGFHDLATLLARPNEPVHCLELAGRPNESGDEVLDARARRELRERLCEIEAEIEDAREANDAGRAARAQGELEAIAASLASALGLSGRPRRVGSASERARTTVTWRIRSAIQKIAAVHPRLGRHLANSIQTGSSCVYVPERRVDWRS